MHEITHNQFETSPQYTQHLDTEVLNSKQWLTFSERDFPMVFIDKKLSTYKKQKHFFMDLGACYNPPN